MQDATLVLRYAPSYSGALDELERTKALIELLKNRVLPEEIDELGHLSVPFYEARAQAAGRRLAQRLGCDVPAYADQGVELTLIGAYLRNVQEQFVDAPIVVRGGVLQASSTRLRFYQELINADSGDLSAAFVQAFELRRIESGAFGNAVNFDDEVLRRANDSRIQIPEHGRPRSIDLERAPHELTLAQVTSRGLGRMGPRKITVEECDAAGFYQRERFTSLPYEGFAEDEFAMAWVFDAADGRRLGIADLESRNTLFSLPRVDHEIGVYGANVAIGAKVFQRAHWVFNLTTDELISVAATVSIPLDLQARRSCPIPPEMLSQLESEYHPDLV